MDLLNCTFCATASARHLACSACGLSLEADAILALVGAVLAVVHASRSVLFNRRCQQQCRAAALACGLRSFPAPPCNLTSLIAIGRLQTELVARACRSIQSDPQPLRLLNN